MGTWYLSKVLGLPDLQVINIVNAFRLMGALVLAFGHRIWFIYLGSILSSASGLYGAMGRVLLSKIVHAEDLGEKLRIL